jgi:diacylglycerol kinase family enzyme
MRICVLVNAAGGTVHRDGGVESERARLVAVFAKFAELRFTLSLLPGSDLVRAARRAAEAAGRREIDAIVVGGGDGSVSAVAGVLAGTSVPLGVLPLGTLNHFAKDLGIPNDIDGAVGVIASGNMRSVDVAEVNGRIFVNNSSVGLYPNLVLQRQRQTTLGRRNKAIATILAAVRALRRFPRRRLSVYVDGQLKRYKTPCLFVGNNKYELDLLTVGTRKHLDAGELSLYAARPRGPLGLVWLAFRVALGGLDAARDLDASCVKALEVGSRASRLLVSLDGEVEVLRPPLQYRTKPGALQVLAPAPLPPPPP